MRVNPVLAITAVIVLSVWVGQQLLGDLSLFAAGFLIVAISAGFSAISFLQEGNGSAEAEGPGRPLSRSSRG